MSQPIVSFYNGAVMEVDSVSYNPNEREITSWPVGEVNAGTESAPLQILVWNNRGGSEDVSDMKDCSVTVLDQGFTDVSPLVTGKWMQVKVNSMGETDFTAIGSPTAKDIKAKGRPDFEISGAANSGDLADTGNFADITAKIAVPLNAPNGTQAFRLRVQYFYT